MRLISHRSYLKSWSWIIQLIPILEPGYLEKAGITLLYSWRHNSGLRSKELNSPSKLGQLASRCSSAKAN